MTVFDSGLLAGSIDSEYGLISVAPFGCAPLCIVDDPAPAVYMLGEHYSLGWVPA